MTTLCLNHSSVLSVSQSEVCYCAQHIVNCTCLAEDCPGTYVAAKTLPQSLSFRENFANGGERKTISQSHRISVVRNSGMHSQCHDLTGTISRKCWNLRGRIRSNSFKGKNGWRGRKFSMIFLNISIEFYPLGWLGFNWRRETSRNTFFAFDGVFWPTLHNKLGLEGGSATANC